MKSMKYLVACATLFFLGFSVASAQGMEGGMTDAQKEALKENMQEYFAALNLTDAQKADFEKISRKYAEQMMDIRESDASKFKKAKELKSVQQSKNAEMKQLLSDEQYQVYLNKQEEIKERMRESRQDRP